MAWNDYVSKVMSPSSNWWDKRLSDKQRFQLQAPQDVGLLDVASAVPTPVGDVASGLLAAQDVSQGNYGSAALNALGLLPFVPSMGGVVKNINKDITANELNNLNPTGGLYVDYTPNIRANQPLGKNMTTLDKTMGGSPDDIITIYRGAPRNQKSIVPGDFVTDMLELAKSYTGDGNVLRLQVRRGDVLDDINEPLGNEYIYRPMKTKKKSK